MAVRSGLGLWRLVVRLCSWRLGGRLLAFLEARGLCPFLPGRSRREACMLEAALLQLGLLPGLLLPAVAAARRLRAEPLLAAGGVLGLGGVALWLWRGEAAVPVAGVALLVAVLALWARREVLGLYGKPLLGLPALLAWPLGWPGMLASLGAGSFLLVWGLGLHEQLRASRERADRLRGLLGRPGWGLREPILQVYARTGLRLWSEPPGLAAGEEHALALSMAAGLGLALGAPTLVALPLGAAAIMGALASGPRALALLGASVGLGVALRAIIPGV